MGEQLKICGEICKDLVEWAGCDDTTWEEICGEAPPAGLTKSSKIRKACPEACAEKNGEAESAGDEGERNEDTFGNSEEGIPENQQGAAAGGRGGQPEAEGTPEKQ